MEDSLIRLETNDEIELTLAEEVIQQALEKTRCKHAPSWVLGGILGGLITSVVINFQAGIFVTLMTAGVSMVNTVNQGNKRLKLLTHQIPITAVMDAELLEDYKEIIGEEAFNKELKILSTAKFPMSKDVKALTQAKKLEVESQGISPDDELAALSSVCCLVLGQSGAGKDYLVSNAARKAKSLNPRLKFYVIDPKGLPHERKYYEDFAEIFDARQCSRMSNSAICAWIKSHIDRFNELSEDIESQWLFILTEGTLIGGAFTREKDDYLASFFDKFTCTSNGFGNSAWVLAQFPNLADLGISNNARTQFRTFGVIKEDGVTNLRQWFRSGVIPKVKLSDVRILCQRSKVGRAFYSPLADTWGVMPEMPNYSGYNRDKRRFEDRNIQQSNDPFERLFSQLITIPSNSLEDALKMLEAPEEKLSELVEKIKQEAHKRQRTDIIDQFQLS